MRTVGQLVLTMRKTASAGDVSLDSLLRSVDPSAQLVFLLIPALILISPLSGIPGFSSVGGLTIALVAGQILIGRRVIWLPKLVRMRSISAEALSRLDRPSRWIDRLARPRFEWLLLFPGRQMILSACLLCGLAMPALELVPFSATALASAVAVLAVSLMVRDGLLAMIGAGLVAGAVALITSIIRTQFSG